MNWGNVAPERRLDRLIVAEMFFRARRIERPAQEKRRATDDAPPQEPE